MRSSVAQRVSTGPEVLRQRDFSDLQGQSLGLVCNQASICSDYRHAIDLFLSSGLDLKAVFGPQHGLFGHTQDNMIEWEGRSDPRTGLKLFSLYGEHRKPTTEMLEGIERLVIDLQDVGARYYTFIWTMLLCLEACSERGIPATVLDRPNPIGSAQIEGPILDMQFASFVGLKPLPIRHGMTIGELARLFALHLPNLDLQVIACEGLRRSDYWAETGYPWVMPSPNMPTPDTAIVYPGGCLLEGTNLSEGRGTTKPFEMLGAPFICGRELAETLNGLALDGCHFRPVEFQPTSNKWAGELCGGIHVHVLDRHAFRPVLTYIAILQQIREHAGDQMEWRLGPYEYEFVKRPIDVIAGNGWLAKSIDELAPLDHIAQRLEDGLVEFGKGREGVLLYPRFG